MLIKIKPECPVRNDGIPYRGKEVSKGSDFEANIEFAMIVKKTG